MAQIWADGSFERGKLYDTCGIGILIRRLNPYPQEDRKVCEHKFSLGMEGVTDNNLAEFYAIEYALFKLSQLKLHPKDKKLSIMTDSQTAINFINGTYKNIPDKYVEIVDRIQFQLRKWDYKIYWIKGHAKDKRQNLCDLLAKSGRPIR